LGIAARRDRRGMVVLACGGTLAAVATAWMANAPIGGALLAIVAFVLVGVGVGAAGTSLRSHLRLRGGD
jgi:BCD family chlorophyll transporter-like MFS transporter